MKRDFSLIKDDCGSISVSTIILLAVFIGLLAYVIDLGHLHTVQSELRNASDTCALRGARAFLPDTIPVDGVSPIPMDPDPLNAETQASLAIGVNRSDNKTLTDLPTGEIQVGIWDYEASGWLGGSPFWSWPPDSSLWGRYIGPGITLITRRDGTHNGGPVGMTLAQLFGMNTVTVGGPNTTQATGALSGVGGTTKGTPTLPFGPMEQYLPSQPGRFHGVFKSNVTNTIGWSTLNPDNIHSVSANDLKKIMQYGAQYDCPSGATVGVQNGVDASVIQWMTKQTPLNMCGLQPISPGSNVYTPSNETNYSAPNPDGGYYSYADTPYMMPVYDLQGPSGNFNQSAIAGFVPVNILQVATSPDNYIDLQILSTDVTYIVPGYGGGRWYGILATEPKLVQ